VLTALDVGCAVVVGASRGGILAMLLACARPVVIAGVVLNDIGPVIEGRGLARIKSYVGRLPTPKSFEDGAEILRHLFADQFPKLSTEDWISFSHRTFEERHGGFVPTYDVRLARILDDVDITHSLPPLWREFDSLAGVPLMLIRGMNSDVLSTATVSAMLARRPDIELIQVPDQGHTPLLSEPDMIARVCAFVRRCH
jgi:pimeloyl-ACP methyl ester carboxylesterase